MPVPPIESIDFQSRRPPRIFNPPPLTSVGTLIGITKRQLRFIHSPQISCLGLLLATVLMKPAAGHDNRRNKHDVDYRTVTGSHSTFAILNFEFCQEFDICAILRSSDLWVLGILKKYLMTYYICFNIS